MAESSTTAITCDQIEHLISTEFDVGEPTQVRQLQAGRNHTYAIATTRGKYALRVRGDAWWIGGRSDLLFEIDLLDYLYARGIPVSKAVPKCNGDTIGTIADGVRQRTYSLFTWASGGVGSKTPERARLVGAALARIHLAADGFVSEHPRYRLDETTMLDRRLPAIEKAFATDEPEDIATIRSTVDEIRRRLKSFDPGPGGWGVIHGDVQQLNFHIDDGVVTFFDFELCAWGWRAADIAEYYTRIPPTHRDPFLTGYESVRPLNDSEKDMLLIIARLAWIREGLTSSTLASMLRDPFIRFEQTSDGKWQMRSPA